MLNQNNCMLYAFMRVVRGNWHNALYIECNCELCSHRRDGFLFAADADGKPVLIPVCTFQTFAGVSIDADECKATLSRQAFESAYSLYIEWHTITETSCPLWQLTHQSIT